MKSKFIILLLIAGLFSACANQPTESPTPVPSPTVTTAPPTETSTYTPLPTNTATPTDTATPTPEPTSETTIVDGTYPAATVSYNKDIFPLLKSRCGSCHGGKKEEGLNVLTYADLIKGSDNGPVIIPGNAAKSLLVDMVASQEMPKRGPKLTPPQVQLIFDWVNQGALDN